MLSDFKIKYKNLLKNEFDLFYESLNKTNSKYIRFNTARGIDYKSEFNDKIIKQDKLFPNVYKLLDNDFDLINTIGFQTGGFYIQNPSSVLPPSILSKKMPENPKILDMSAAPGGKTTALSEILDRKGLIVANELSSSRMKFLNFNLEKHTAWNVKTLCKDGRFLDKIYDEYFDGILLDAPCTNENKILKDKKVASAWSKEFILRMQKLQKELISTAYNILKPGGYILYSTCTFSIEENEQIIEYMLSNFDIELIDINNKKFPNGLSGNSKIDESVIRVMPHKMDYDGFFIACLRKKGILISDSKIIKNNNFNEFNKFFNKKIDYGIINEIKGNLFYESKITDKINYKKTGIKIGKRIKDRIELSAQSIWEFGNHIKNNYKIYLTYDECLEYFKGNDINKTTDVKEAFAIFYNELPIGTIKQVNNKLKNKLDRFFLYGRNY
jgi:16S rRNA (cytosine1407-C5)-methyltransferase